MRLKKDAEDSIFIVFPAAIGDWYFLIHHSSTRPLSLSNSRTHTHTHSTHTHTHTHTHSLTQTDTQDVSFNRHLCPLAFMYSYLIRSPYSSIQFMLSHAHTLTHAHSLSLSLTSCNYILSFCRERRLGVARSLFPSFPPSLYNLSHFVFSIHSFSCLSLPNPKVSVPSIR
jgi:hypothetical protein